MCQSYKTTNSDLWEQLVSHTKSGWPNLYTLSGVGRTSKIPHSKWEVGHSQVADYCITISCGPALLWLQLLFKATDPQLLLWTINPAPPQYSSPSHSLSWILAAVCHSRADHVIWIQHSLVVASVKDPAVPGVCVFTRLGTYSFAQSFIQPFIKAYYVPQALR